MEGAKADAAVVQFVDQGDELAHPAAQAVEVQDDRDVALTQVLETSNQVRSVGGSAGGTVLEDALAPGVVQGIELAVEALTAFDGGYAGIADESHRVLSPQFRK